MTGPKVSNEDRILAADCWQLRYAGTVDLPNIAAEFDAVTATFSEPFDYDLVRAEGLGLGTTGAYHAWREADRLLFGHTGTMAATLHGIGHRLVHFAEEMSEVDAGVHRRFVELVSGSGLHPGHPGDPLESRAALDRGDG